MYINDQLCYSGDTEQPANPLKDPALGEMKPNNEPSPNNHYQSDEDEIRITYETYKQRRLYSNFETNQIKEIKHLIEKIIHPNIYGGSHERQKRIQQRTESMKLSTSASLNLKSTTTFQTSKKHHPHYHHHHHSKEKLATVVNEQLLKLPALTDNNNNKQNVEKNEFFKNKSSINASDENFSSGTILRTIDKLNISSDTGQLRKISPKNKYDPYELAKLSQQQTTSSSNGNDMQFNRASLLKDFAQYEEKQGGNFLKLKKRHASPNHYAHDLNLPNINDYLIKAKPVVASATLNQNGASGSGGDEAKMYLSLSNSLIIYDTSHKANGASAPKISEATSKISTTRNFYDHRRNPPQSTKLNKNFKSEYDISSQMTIDNDLNGEIAKQDQPTSKVSTHSGKLYVDIYIPSF
jgi:hypothetical protein